MEMDLIRQVCAEHYSYWLARRIYIIFITG